MEIYFLMVPYKFLLKYIFVKLQEPEKETEFRFFLDSPTNFKSSLLKLLCTLARFFEGTPLLPL